MCRGAYLDAKLSQKGAPACARVVESEVELDRFPWRKDNLVELGLAPNLGGLPARQLGCVRNRMQNNGVCTQRKAPTCTYENVIKIIPKCRLCLNAHVFNENYRDIQQLHLNNTHACDDDVKINSQQLVQPGRLATHLPVT